MAGCCLPCLKTMDVSGPGAIDAAIAAGIDLDGSPIPSAMLELYQEVMSLENSRPRSGVLKSMRNRIVRSGAKHLDQVTLNQRLEAAGWEGLKPKEIGLLLRLNRGTGRRPHRRLSAAEVL